MAGTCEALTIEENMALAMAARRAARAARGTERGELRELFRDKLRSCSTWGSSIG